MGFTPDRIAVGADRAHGRGRVGAACRWISASRASSLCLCASRIWDRAGSGLDLRSLAAAASSTGKGDRFTRWSGRDLAPLRDRLNNRPSSGAFIHFSASWKRLLLSLIGDRQVRFAWQRVRRSAPAPRRRSRLESVARFEDPAQPGRPAPSPRSAHPRCRWRGPVGREVRVGGLRSLFSGDRHALGPDGSSPAHGPRPLHQEVIRRRSRSL